MTPYQTPVLNAVLARYKNKLFRARCIIERSFGMMKTYWRSIFFKFLEVSHAFVPVVVPYSTILHNLCLGNGDIMEPDEEDVEAANVIDAMNEMHVDGICDISASFDGTW